MLALLDEHREGLQAGWLGKAIGLSIQATSQRLKRMQSIGIVIQRRRLWFLEKKGTAWLNVKCGGSVTKPNTFNSGRRARLHAMQVKNPIARTEYRKLGDTLDYLGIRFTLTGNHKSPTYSLQFVHAGHSFRIAITTRHIITWAVEQRAPLNLRGPILESRAISGVGAMLEDFLALTGFNTQRTLEGRLVLLAAYREIALEKDELAESVCKGGRYVPLAYDRRTGTCTIYADGSKLWELETNRHKDFEPVRRWAQGIEDGVIRPYEDELRTRERLDSHERTIAADRELIHKYAHQIEIHLRIMKKIDQRLNQRVLKDWLR